MKVMICQPMNGKDDETIKAERQGIVEMLEKQGHSVVNTIFSEEPPFISKNKGLWYMGKSLIAMSEVDVLYCMKGWEKARGCAIEHACAVNYGIDVWYEEGEELDGYTY